jgi:hypothetical protein
MLKINIKGLVLAALFTGTMFSASAQDGQDAKFRLGGILGMNISSFYGGYGRGLVSNKSTVGLRVGVLADYSFNKWIAVSPELVFAQKGTQMKTKFGSVKYKTITRPCYLQIPLNAMGRYTFKQGITVFGIAGPYFAFGVGGNLIAKDSEGHKEKESLFGHSDAGMKRFDFGLTFGVGAEYKHIFLRFHYELGLVNMSKYVGSGSMKNSTFSISAGYYFLRK